MVSLSARYAIKAVMHLARDDSWVGSEDLARITSIPCGYIVKVLQRLTVAGMLRTQRGLHGGYRLQREAGAITLWDIVQAIDRPPTCHICQSCANCLGCGADQVLAAIEADVVRSLRAHDIGTLVATCRMLPTTSHRALPPSEDAFSGRPGGGGLIVSDRRD